MRPRTTKHRSRREAPEDAPQGVRPWVPRLARLMDSQFRIPGTGIRFGLDPIIGIVPVLGDTATLLIGAGMLREASRLGAGPAVRAKIVRNLLFDWLVGLIPGIDLILDTAVKAHTKNARLLQEHAQPDPQRGNNGTRRG